MNTSSYFADQVGDGLARELVQPHRSEIGRAEAVASRVQFYTELYSLHQQLIAGDPTVVGDIAELAFHPLIRQLRAMFLRVDDHILQEKAADALLEYGKSPEQAKAQAGAGVMGFLVLRAQSRVKTALKRERRRKEVEEQYSRGLPSRKSRNSVELASVQQEHHPEKPGPETNEPDPVDPIERAEQIQEVLSGVDNEQDRRIVQLMLDGVRATADYARVLGIQDRPVAEQRRIVKQHKDRLKVALSRQQTAKRSPPRRRGRPPRGQNQTGNG
jgi:hypothetical protein